MTQRVQPVSIGTAGLGNYAGTICQLLRRHGQRRDAPVRLVAVCEPDAQRYPKAVDELSKHGVRVCERFDDLLAEPIEAVWLPLPIPLHRPFTERALAAGKAVMCEKPAAGSIDDVDLMIAARDRARRPVAIGFQDMYDPTTVTLKRLLLEGAIGELRTITVHAAGARGSSYFGRSPWAGKLRHEGAWVLDSPISNAHAHELNLALFLAGPKATESAHPLAIEAELYRVNPIESFDTASLRLTLDTGPTLLVLMTHGCEFFIDGTIVIEGQRGKIYWVRETLVIETPRGAQVLRRRGDARDHMVERFAMLVRGQADETRGVCTLESARQQVLAVNAAVEVAVIHDVPEPATRTVDTLMGRTRAVIGMESMLTLCARRGVMLHESGQFDWTHAPGRLDLRHYGPFKGPAGDG